MRADFARAHDHVLALKVAMHEAAREFREFGRDLLESRTIDFCRHAEVAPQAVLEKVVLFPAIERLVELLLQVQFPPARCEMRAGVQHQRLVEGALVQRASRQPGIAAMRPQIEVARVFHHDQALDIVVEEHLRHTDADAGQKVANGHVVPVLGPVFPVTHENQRAISDAQPPEFTARPALFDRTHGDEVTETFRRHAPPR
jgi:hypothetical protein